jgi:hypothetical protein
LIGPRRIALDEGESRMKKIDPRRGIWDYLFGGGWCGGGASG